MPFCYGVILFVDNWNYSGSIQAIVETDYSVKNNKHEIPNRVNKLGRNRTGWLKFDALKLATDGVCVWAFWFVYIYFCLRYILYFKYSNKSIIKISFAIFSFSCVRYTRQAGDPRTKTTKVSVITIARERDVAQR